MQYFPTISKTTSGIKAVVKGQIKANGLKEDPFAGLLGRLGKSSQKTADLSAASGNVVKNALASGNLVANALASGDPVVAMDKLMQAESLAQAGEAAGMADLKLSERQPFTEMDTGFVLGRLSNFKSSSSENTDLSFLSDLKVSTEDFSQMKDALLNMGFTEDDLKKIEDLISGEGGLGWEAFLDQLSGMIAQFEAFAPVELSTEEMRHLQTLFQEMGFTPQESGELMDDLSQDRLDKVWAALSRRMATLSMDSLDVRPEQLQALAKALRLSEEASNRVLQLFSHYEEGGLAKEEFKALLDNIKQESSSQRQETAATLSELRSSLGSTLNQALSAASDESAQQEQRRWIKAQAEETTERTAMGKLFERLADKSDENGENPLGDAPGGSTQKDADSGRETQNLAKKLEEAVWNKLLEKVNLASGNLAQGETLNPTVSYEPKASYSPQQVFQQVQNGVLRSLSDGTKELTLRLDPPELGRVQLTISVANNEVSAVIRADSPEAGKVITEQLQQIREVLEQQGLKVQKLEVQTQLQEERGSAWSGTGEHNLTQEQRDQMEKNSFFRRLSANSGEVAQEMQPEAESAIVSHGGLYLIA